MARHSWGKRPGLALVATATVVAACGGVGSGGDPAGPPGLEQTLPTTGAVSFQQHVQPILTGRCTHCHYDPATGTSSESPQKPPLNPERSWASLVSAPVPCKATKVLVVPGDTASSALLQILSGAPPCGSTMPKNTAGLAQIAPVEFQVIQRWVQQGAPNN